MYISASFTGASGLPLAVAFHSHAAWAAASLAFLALVISTAPGMIVFKLPSVGGGLAATVAGSGGCVFPAGLACGVVAEFDPVGGLSTCATGFSTGAFVLPVTL